MQLLESGRVKAYTSIHSLLDVGVPLAAVERLVDADAFRSLKLDRRQALWEISAVKDRPVGLFDGQPSESAAESAIQLPVMSVSENVIQDYGAIALSLKAHPVSFVRKQLFAANVLSTAELNNWPDGTLVRVAGLVLVRQRPGTASGICFITIEDETGSANLVVFAKLFEKYRKEVIQSQLLMVEGQLQREGEVTHVVVRRCYNMSALLRGLSSSEQNTPDVSTLSRADERSDEHYIGKDKRIKKNTMVQGEIFPQARNFK